MGVADPLGRERAAQTAGVLGLVLGIEPGEHHASALVDGMDETEIPAGVAHFEPRQMAASTAAIVEWLARPARALLGKDRVRRGTEGSSAML
jgi:hypothetical protein